jgi:hypothetical protein
MDWQHEKVPGLYEGPVLPAPAKTVVGTLFKLKTLHDATAVETLHLFTAEGTWVKIEDGVELAARMICQLGPRDRLRAMEYMRARFCEHCGYDQPEGHRCYCNRDPERN